MVKGLFVPARRDFCISFLFVLVVCCGFKLNQKKKKKEKKKEKKDKQSRLETSDHQQPQAACLPLLLFCPRKL
jgi:type III secretory pathway component EscV